MARARHSLVLALAGVLTAVGCGAEPTKTPGVAPTGSQNPGDSATTGLSGEEFVKKANSLSGSTVTLGRCSLLTTPGSDGALPCRVLDKQGMDIADASGLPVDIFIKQADLTPEGKAVLSACGTSCTVEISGKLDRATDGTGYLSMTGVSLKPVG